MKTYLNILFTVLVSTALSQTRISGLITDSLDAPVPFVPVALLSLPDSTIIKGTITDEAGKYSMEQKKSGSYLLKLTVLGYREKTSEVFAIDSSASDNLVFHLKLYPDAHMLGDVSVTAMKKTVEFKNGNILVNVENSPLAKGNSAFDLLMKLPGLSVYNNKIILQGKEGVIVMIDNRPQVISGDQLMNMLKSMNADLIKSIEILKNPPVKYDASGTSGMINILTRKVSVGGLTGTVFSSYSQGFYERVLSGASINYKTKKILLYGTISGDNSHYRMVENFKKKFESDTSIMNFNGDNIAKSLESSLNYKAGIDWLPTESDIIGFKIEGGPGQNTSNTQGRNSITGDNKLGFDHLDSRIYQTDKWNTTNFDLNYGHKLDTLGSSFSLVADYTSLKETIYSDNINTFFDHSDVQTLPANNYRSDSKSSCDILSMRADLTKVINETSSFEAGLKTAYAKTLNNYLFERNNIFDDSYSKDTSLSNRFQYTEITYAGYFNYLKSVGKLNMQLGVRIENTYLTGENIDRNFTLHREYFNVFPNLSFDYKRNDNHDFQLNLSRRIDRPYFSDLNPFIFFNDQYSYRQGNPFLLPDYANRADLVYNYKDFFSTSIAYAYTENIMLDYTSQNDSTNVTMQSIKNMKSASTIEYSLFFEKSLTKKWDISVSGSFARKTFSGSIDDLNFQRTGITYYGTVTNNILLIKDTRLEVNATYFGPNISGIFIIKPRVLTSLAINKSFFKNKLDLTVGVDDIFYSFIFKSMANYENQNWSFSRISDTRRFRISLNYTFGKTKIEERNVNSSNEEEIERLNH